MEIDRVLVATDLGPDAEEALVQGCTWARTYDAELLACVILPTRFVRPQSPLDRDQTWQAQQTLRERFVELGVPASTAAVRHGAPSVEICKLAEELDVDLIVLGSSQCSSRWSLAGGTAERVVRLAKKPVLIAKPSPLTATVLAATDLSDPCFPVIAAGADYAERRGGDLSVLHCLEQEVIAPSPSIPLHSFCPSLEQQREKGVTALARAMAGMDVRGVGVVESTPARTTILQEAKRRECEMIVVGTSGRRGLSRLAFGNLAEWVFRAAPCSTLVVRLGERRCGASW